MHTFRELPLITVNNLAEFLSNNINNLRGLIPHILHTFSEFVSNNTDIFKELLVENMALS